VSKRLVFALAIVLVSACGGNGGTPSPPVTTAAEPSGTTSASIAREIPPGETEIEPGEYTFSQFEPTMTFRVDSGWQTGHRRAEFFDVWNGTDAFIGWARPEFIVGRDGRRVTVDHMSAGAAIRALAANPAVVSAGRAREVTVGGVSGASLEFRTLPGGELFGGSEGAFATAPRAARLRISAVSLSGPLVLVLEVSLTPPHAPNFRLTDGVAQTVEFPE
jgi:hypothetical protein